MASTMIHIRIDEELKNNATQALAAMGLTVSDAVRLLLTRVAAEQSFPFALKVPNAETVAAMQEARAITRARFSSVDELFQCLDHEH
ncbi:type II toxin-antitoxin system RelB/DinJ family antitoxin [uncultured Thiothrix sp.]|uniref:type II toxin-antitoxin system RelB/DinJ family antitoxin n=1 Tax=uncultured Thiothrix sp. TaxID=223185 RepID=UPI00262D65B6|nr:type II toxin-antitoxin system RelB/DinJ family antitoxin [uncultured Thiothrix sp.]HMT93906.1 type II toxin-antitoxin system RelB/DinJ family antitoxin [Thiolinea sp.]